MKGLHALLTILITTLVASAIIPITIDAITNTNTTGWDAGAIVLWNLLKLFAVLAVVLPVLAYTIKASGFGGEE